jgi:hypothetical protein
MTFWCGSRPGSADPYLWPIDPDPDIFVITLQEANKFFFLFNEVFLIITFRGTFTSFFKDNKSKRSHKTVGMKVFLTIFA